MKLQTHVFKSDKLLLDLLYQYDNENYEYIHASNRYNQSSFLILSKIS